MKKELMKGEKKEKGQYARRKKGTYRCRAPKHDKECNNPGVRVTG